MPLRHTLIAAAAIAATSGGIGYQLGKHQAPANLVGTSHETPSLRHTITPRLDPTKLRATLDAESRPLARFQLALRNLDAWIKHDPLDALNWLASQAPSARRDEVIRMALHQISETDARTAATWAETHLTGPELNNTLIAIAANWARQNGAEAASYFLKRPTTAERDAAAEQIFFSWATNEPAAAMEALKSESGWGELTPTLRRAALAAWAKSEPEAACAASLAISRSLQDPATFANTLANWATMDLDASSTWLLTNLPASPERSVAAAELAIIFAHQAPETGVEWLDKLTLGPERNAAASALASAWARSSAAEAAQWAASGTSPDLSDDALSQIAHHFLMKDPAAFAAWRAALPASHLKSQLETLVPPPAANE